MTQNTSASRSTNNARDFAQIVVFAALIAALTVLGSIQVGPVPITLQTLGVLLAGAILGPRKGTLAVALYLAVGAIGLPVFAGGSSGLAPFVGVTGGFLFGFPFAAWVTGILTARIMPKYPLLPACGATLAGAIAVYAIGAPWLAVALGPAALASLAIFIPGDLIKVVVATLIATSVHRALPGLFGSQRAE